jgi:hypothetical protein
MTRAELYDFFCRHPLAVLSTASLSGEPESALMRVLVTQNLELFFDTRMETRKYRNFLANPACSFVIGCEGPASVQFEGLLAAAAGEELARLKEMYFAAAPQAREREFRTDLAWLIARPKWIRYSDYSQLPPLVEEFTF